MWIMKDVAINQTNVRELKNAIRAIEIRVINILDCVCQFRTNK